MRAQRLTSIRGVHHNVEPQQGMPTTTKTSGSNSRHPRPTWVEVARKYGALRHPAPEVATSPTGRVLWRHHQSGTGASDENL